MRVSLFGILAAIGVAGLAGNASAADVVAPAPGLLNSAYLEAYADYTFLEGDFGAEDDEFFGGGAAVRWSIPFGDMVSVQLDGLGDLSENAGDDDENNYEYSFGGAGHLSFRDPESWLLGVFGGVIYAEEGSNGDSTGFFIGGEGQLYWDQNTFYLQAGYFDGGNADFGEAVFTNSYFVRGQFRHYFSENFRGVLEAAYGNGRVDEEKHTDAINWGVELEYKPEEFPLSFFAAYEGLDLDQTPAESDKLTEHVIKVGARFDFGATSIFERDRLGPGLDTPRFGRWMGEANGPLE